MSYTFFRFLLVGIINTMVGLSSIYIFLHVGGFSYWVSTFLGNSIGAFVSFFLNRNFTFRSNRNITSSITRFILVILICYFTSYTLGKNLVLWALRDNFYISSEFKTDLAILISTGLYTILNYLCQKIFVFPHKDSFC
jgi:putative flippase GtrA